LESIPSWLAGLIRIEAVHENKNRLISDPFDPDYIQLRSLQTTQGRTPTGRYIIEGIRHVARAFEVGAPIELLFVDQSSVSNPFGQKLVRRIRQSGVKSNRLSPRLYRALTLAFEPQGIGAVLRQHWLPVSEIKPARNSLWLVVESIDQPGNLGTIIRTAEATGVSGIFLLGPQSDPWDPACVRATMGALFSQRLVRCTTREFTEWARANRVSIVGSSPAGLIDYKALRCRWPVALMIGSERHGLSQELIEMSDFMVRIPMKGRADSINAAVAAGVLLFELANCSR
jgi:TrmH family RNA methyltransferase